MKADQQMKIRLPADVKAYLFTEARRNSSTQNSEVVRSIRERMDRQAPETKTASESAATLTKA